VSWVGQVKPIAGIRKAYKILAVKINERAHMGDLGVDLRIILKRILNQYDVMML
jgi:hypothetical protein